jgi:prolipoprotein diacylglyceryltransferase
LALVAGFTLYNATIRTEALNAKHITTTAFLAPTSILLGALLGYTLFNQVSVAFFLAVTTGTLIYSIGSLVADILIIIGDCKTEGDIR